MKAVNTPYRNMFSLISAFSFLSELTSEIAKPMSRVSVSTIITDTGYESSSRAVVTVRWSLHRLMQLVTMAYPGGLGVKPTC